MKNIGILLISLLLSANLYAQVSDVSNEYYYEKAVEKEGFWTKVKKVFSIKEKSKSAVSEPVLTKNDPNRNINKLSKKQSYVYQKTKQIDKPESDTKPTQTSTEVVAKKTKPKKEQSFLNELLNGKETTAKEKSSAVASKNNTTPNPTAVKRNYNSYYKPGNVLYEKGIRKTTPTPTQNTPKVAVNKDTIKSKVQEVKSKPLTTSNPNLKISPSKNIAVAEAKNGIPKTTEKSINSKTITKPAVEKTVNETKVAVKNEVKNETKPVAKIEPKIEPKAEVKNEIKHELPKENVIRNEIKSLSLTSSATGKSAYFYSGIVNGKIYAISNLSNKGEIIKVTNLSNGKSVYAEVMDNLPAKDTKSGIILKLSDNAKLPLDQKNNTFNVKINY